MYIKPSYLRTAVNERKDYKSKSMLFQRDKEEITEFQCLKKIKSIRIDKDSRQARIIEAWQSDTDGAKTGTREMCIIRKGTFIDRIGDENGFYLSPMKSDGTPYSLKERATGDYLPEKNIEDNDSYHKYKVLRDFTRENFEDAINKSKLSNIDKIIRLKELKEYFDDCAKDMNTYKKQHEGEAYYKYTSQKPDDIKKGVIDEMFLHEDDNKDGGGIQFITPLKIKELIDLGMISKDIK